MSIHKAYIIAPRRAEKVCKFLFERFTRKQPNKFEDLEKQGNQLNTFQQSRDKKVDNHDRNVLAKISIRSRLCLCEFMLFPNQTPAC